MPNLNEKPCEYCGNMFAPLYTDKNGHQYTRDNTNCCSKSCATQNTRSITRIDLKRKALDFIREKNEYCTKDDICNGIKHSSKTFTQHGLKIVDLNHELGFHKPKSKFQETVNFMLKEVFPVVESEKRFDGLVGTTGHPLQVDFYIPCINTVVEADGSQHKDPKHPWRQWNNGTVIEYDKIKDQFFKENGIEIVRIPYKRNIKESDVLSRLG